MTSVKLGVHLPFAGPGASPQAIARVAEEAESIGLDSVWTWERLMRPTVPIAMGGTGGPVMTAIGPKPIHPDGPRLAVGAVSPPALERAGRLGVGLSMVIFDWDTTRDSIEQFRSAAAAAGHDPETLPVILQVNGDITEKPVHEPAPLLGSPEQVAADFDHAAQLGVMHICWHSVADPLGQLPLLGQLSRGRTHRSPPIPGRQRSASGSSGVPAKARPALP